MATVSQSGGNDPSPTTLTTSESVSSDPARLGHGEEKAASPDSSPGETDDMSVKEAEGSQAEIPNESSVEDDTNPKQGSRIPREDRCVTPEVRYYNFEGFMNRMVGDQGDYVIEVLVTNAEWYEDIEAEKTRRDQRGNTVEYQEQQKEKSKDASKVQLKLDQGTESPPDGGIHRIRIRSKAILEALSSVSTYDRLKGERVFEFCTPFKTIEYSHVEMKNALAKMEIAQKENAGPVSNGHLPKAAKIPKDKSLEPEQAPVSDEAQCSKERSDAGEESTEIPTEVALQHMRCYVDFVEDVILPIRKRFELSDKKTRPAIKYEEIPYLFRPGAMVFLPQQGMNRQTLQRSAVQQIWRAVNCRPIHAWTKLSDKTDTPDKDRSGTKWLIYCLDYDGDKLVPVWKVVTFKPFYGERDITSLECYPLEFHPEHQTLLEAQSRSGAIFKSCIADSIRHLYYTGWTPITGILAECLTDEKGEEIRYPEYIESEVVIDFKEALQNHPNWETEVKTLEITGAMWTVEINSDITPLIWEEYPTGLHGSRRNYSEKLPALTGEYGIYQQESIEYFDNDRFIVGKAGIDEESWSKEDLSLLPKRLFGYVLRERRFARLEVQGIDTNTHRTGVSLDDIQMQPSRRRIIRSAVSAHFRSRQKEKQGLSTINLDIIRGKGKGLVILLHGPPGVGKTATAEAVAIENSKPLFPITCGDLGFTPSAVDKTLREIFRYAHLWECVLLLDEADIFLTQRKSHGGSLERHALAGVFLRVLEYYSGILFITTNRVGAIDEAFQSRVHLSLYYPHLSLDDTIEILASNLKRLPRVKQEGRDSSNNNNNGYIKVMDDEISKFIRTEYENYSRAVQKRRGPWNGRQIRNAVQIAAGLALYDKETAKEDDGLPAILTAGHFQSVAETMTEFEEYLRTARAGDSTWLARQRQDRNDDYQHQQGGYNGGAGAEEPFPGVGGSPGYGTELRATPRSSKFKAADTILPGSAGSVGAAAPAARRKGPPPPSLAGGSAGRIGRKAPLQYHYLDEPSAAGYYGGGGPATSNVPAARSSVQQQQRTTRVAHGEYEYEDEFEEQRHDVGDFGEVEEEEMQEQDTDLDWDGDSPSRRQAGQAAAVGPYGHSSRTSLVGGRRTNRYIWNQDR